MWSVAEGWVEEGSREGFKVMYHSDADLAFYANWGQVVTGVVLSLGMTITCGIY